MQKLKIPAFKGKKSIPYYWLLKFDGERSPTFVKFKRARFTSCLNSCRYHISLLFYYIQKLKPEKISSEKEMPPLPLHLSFSAKQTINSRIRACSIFEKYFPLGGFLYLRNTPWGEPRQISQIFVLQRNKKNTNHATGNGRDISESTRLFLIGRVTKHP